ncbi:MAG: ABC transporter permease [Candidatus Sericytochromatia bacterium]
MVDNLKSSFIKFFTLLGKMNLFTQKTLKTLFTKRVPTDIILQNMYDIGVKTLPVLGAICIFVGTNMAFVGYQIFKQFGGQDLLGVYVGLSCIREMAPILVGAIMAAKPGTDMTATIATMRVKEQIDALEVMAIDPFWFLIVPRLLAFIFVAPLLVIFADFFCIFSAYMTAVFQLKLASGKFIEDMVTYLQVLDFFKGITKGFVSSVLVCIISCYFGFNSAPGPKGVSKAINTAVVISASLIVVVNYFMTEIMYGT